MVQEKIDCSCIAAIITKSETDIYVTLCPVLGKCCETHTTAYFDVFDTLDMGLNMSSKFETDVETCFPSNMAEYDCYLLTQFVTHGGEFLCDKDKGLQQKIFVQKQFSQFMLLSYFAERWCPYLQVFLPSELDLL